MAASKTATMSPHKYCNSIYHIACCSADISILAVFAFMAWPKAMAVSRVHG
jgi:hypothetical protein